jgi:ribose 5-phosphate isomerase RpiB
MGYVQTSRSSRNDANVMSLGWESLGRAVQTRTLEAVAQHFFDVGLAELCLEALVRTQLQEIEHE